MMEDFSYNVMTELEAQTERSSLLPEGEYDASVERYEGKMSSSGNRMVVFGLHVYDKNGKAHEINDYIAFTPKMTWKLRHHCVSAGLTKEFEDKTWRPRLSVGKTVRVKIIVQEGQEIPHDKLRGKASGAKYPPKNSVDDYIEPTNVKSSAVHKSNEGPEFNDDIPW